MPAPIPFVHDVRGPTDPTLANTGGKRVETFTELQTYFGITHDTRYGYDAVEVGQYYWGLAGFTLSPGPATYITVLQEADGTPIPGILVFRHWAGAPTLPSTPIPPYFATGIAGFTEGEDGDVGFGYGGESMVIDGKGPDHIWPASDPEPEPGDEPDPNRARGADCVHNLGWLGGTNHLTPRPLFVRMQKQGVTPPPSNGEGYRFLLVVDGTVVGTIPVVPIDASWNTYLELQGPDGLTLGVVPVNP